jgi:hypothetical protein
MTLLNRLAAWKAAAAHTIVGRGHHPMAATRA